MIITKKYTPRVADLGPDGVITPGALAEILEDAGNEHSSRVALSLVDQSKTGKTFIITEWDISISGISEPGEELTVETWITGHAPSLISVRQYRVTGKDGNELARADAKVAIVDLETGKPEILDAKFFDAYEPEEEIGIPKSRRPREEKEWDGEYEVIPEKCFADFNGHLHNTKYFPFFCRNLTAGDYKRINHIRLLFLKPVAECAAMTVRYKNTDDGTVFGLYGKDGLRSLAFIGLAR